MNKVDPFRFLTVLLVLVFVVYRGAIENVPIFWLIFGAYGASIFAGILYGALGKVTGRW